MPPPPDGSRAMAIVDDSANFVPQVIAQLCFM
jgi:hypothetical protein